MIKILIVDDSATETALLKEFFTAEGDMQVIGCAKNGEEAIKLTALLKPDIITMDIIMPGLNGLEATRSIMAHHPTPIIVISSAINDQSLQLTFQALEAGALSVLEKPDVTHTETFKKSQQRIIEVVRSMAEIKVVKKRFHVPAHSLSRHRPLNPPTSARHYEMIAIGASVGGPQALKKILAELPANFPLPIIVVQHMTRGFIKGFAHWLNDHTALQVKEAENHEPLRNGVVYFAPDLHHLEVIRIHGKLTIKLSAGAPISGFCPSITVLLKSVAKICGETALGILLTGMGSDGAQGLLELKKANGHTIIQGPKSAVVFGMAGVAQSMDAADKIIELEQIADYLIKISKK